MKNHRQIYLYHSTPAFFVRDNRSVSHGCIRVQKPYKLALFLLGKKAAEHADDLLYNMTGDSIEDKTRYIGSLKVEPQVPIYITYYTVYPSVDGTLQYLPDVYGYEQAFPWDKKQTNESLRPNTIEETFELCDALLKNDTHNICKELGDVLMHVLFYSVIGSETESFDIADVCNMQADKLIFRHPHVYHPSQVGAGKPLP